MLDRFSDAQAWYDRAREHIAEYRQRTSEPNGGVWTIHAEQGQKGIVYSLRFNRDLLIHVKVTACEAANALFQSLDNIIGVAAREAGVARTQQISWPWAIEPDPADPTAMRPAIGKKLKELCKQGVPAPWIALIEETFAAPATSLLHIDVLKEVSLSGKHWELVPTAAKAVAIGWTLPGSTEQVFANIPVDHFDAHDAYVFHEGEPLEAPRFLMAVGFELAAAAKEFRPEPVAAFEYTARFVAMALEKARSLPEEAAA